MAFLSELIGRPISDLDGNRIGKLVDLIATKNSGIPHPVIAALVMAEKTGEQIIPYSDVIVLLSPAIALSVRKSEIHPYSPAEGDFRLAEEVMDKQIIDTDDVRVVRVNDIELVRVNGSVVVSNVDVGTTGLFRRIGLGNMAQGIKNLFKKELHENFISWDDVELLPSEQLMRLRVPSERMSDLHPADIANIIGDMNRSQSSRFLDSLNIEQLAETLEAIEEDFQVSIIENMSDEKVADVLEEMAPDEAADLLAELPKERSEKLIELMEDDEAEDVRMLLTYPEDSAGGIMTTEYIAIRPDLNAEQAIRVLRETAHEAETIFYVYVTDETDHLIGVFSLRDLVLSKPETPVTEFMHKRVVNVDPLDSQDHVAHMIANYNLLAIPVLNEENVLLGIVTSDDALDKIIPTVWKKRLPRYYR